MVKNLPANAGDIDRGSVPGVGKILCRRKGHPTPVFLPGISCGQRRLGAPVQEVAKRHD